MADTPQVDYDALSKDATFRSMRTDQQRDYLSSVDKSFASLDPESQKGYIAHLTGVNPTFIQAASVAPDQLTPKGTTLSGQSMFSSAGQKEAALGERYSDYMKQSGEFAGTMAGTMATGGLLQGPGLVKLAGRALATGAGAGAGAATGGATPTEAAETGAVATVSQPVAEAIGAGGSAIVKKVFGAKTVSAIPLTEEWARINDALGVKASAIRIGENATSLESAATMPGRALAKAGLTSEQLAKMTPLEQQAAIQPIRARAAAELDAGFKAASGTTFDVGNSAFPIFKKIINPKAGVDLQQQAIDTFNSLAEEAGIANQRAATPEQARTLRQLLGYGARFNQGGDLSSLAPIRAELYRAVNRDLHAAVPGLQDLDQFYSDVKGASVAARNGVAKMATKAPAEPPPTFMQETLDTAKRKVVPYAVGSLLGGGIGAYAGRKLYDLATTH